MTLLGPTGRPISSSDYKKEVPKALGPAFGDWAGRDIVWNQMPGGAILQFDLSALTLADYRAMRYHPQLNACISLMTFLLHQVDWHMECVDPKIASEMDDILRPAWTRLVRGLSQSFWAGYSPMVIEFENDVNKRQVIISKFKDLYPEDCKVHWKTVDGSYAPPGMQPQKFKVYDGIDQWGSKWPIPAENTLWYPLLMENGDYYGRKLLKAAFSPWYFSILMHLFANRYYERFGEPLPVGRGNFDESYPDPEDPTKTITGKEVVDRILMNLRNRAVVSLPSDRDPVTKEYEFELDYLESQMRGADFERYLARLDEEMSMALFQPLLLLRNADVGSHNLGVQHVQTWLWIMNAFAYDMKEYIDRYPVSRLVDYNFSEKAPRAYWVPNKMGKQNVETLRAIITELTRAGTVRPDLTEMGQALGLSLHEVKTVTAPTDLTTPEGDTRPPRDRTGRVTSGPRGVGEPRATGRQVSARINSQVAKAWQEDRFGPGFKPTLGFHKRFIQSLVTEGASDEEAATLTDKMYKRIESWLENAISLGVAEYEGPNDFMSMFDRVLDIEIDALIES